MSKEQRAVTLIEEHKYIHKVAWILGIEEIEVTELLRPRFLAMLRNGVTLREISTSMRLTIETLEKILA